MKTYLFIHEAEADDNELILKVEPLYLVAILDANGTNGLWKDIYALSQTQGQLGLRN